MTTVVKPLTALQIGMGASRTAMSGTDRYFLDLLRALPGAGVNVRGLVLGEPQALDDPVPNVESFAPLGAPRSLRLGNERRAVRNLIGTADVVVSHCAAHASPVLDLVRGRPLIAHFHGPWASESWVEGKGPVRYAIRRTQEALTYRQVDRFIVLSRAFGEILAAQNRIGWDRIRVIPGGVTMSHFASLPSRREAREALQWPQDRPIIATARRLVPSKGIDRLIDAVAEVRRTIPDIFCGIAGKGPLAADLQRRIDERGAGGHIRLMGYVPDDMLKLLYRAADLFVVPTVALEGFGMVVLESLACGTPALVTPVGGLGEAIGGLDPGLVLGGSTAADLADGIARAFDGRLPLPGEAACLAYARDHDWTRIAGRVAEVYRELA